MAASLHSQLLAIEHDLLHCISQGPTALRAFGDTWSKLQSFFQAAIHSVDNETLILAQEVSSRVELISTGFIELYEEADAFSLSLQDDLNVIFGGLQVNDQTAQTYQETLPQGEDSRPLKWASRPTPAYLEEASLWLLRNLQNPYPSKGIKESIAAKAQCSTKDVDHWFTDARRRIGWNKLRVKCFDNKRSLIVKAATQYFNPASLRTVESQTYHMEFLSIERTAARLFGGKVSLSLDVESDTDNSLSSSGPSYIRSRLDRTQSQTSRRNTRYPTSYPSPERSPDRSPEPPSPLPLTRKRRIRCDSDDETCNKQNGKKARRESAHIPDIIAIASLLSPAATVYECQSPSQRSDSSVITESSRTPPPSRKRKRRLSEGDERGAVRCPQQFPSPCRPYAVSDPLPLSSLSEGPSSIEETIEVNDVLPDPVSAIHPESLEVAVDFYSYEFPPHILGLGLAFDSPAAGSRTPLPEFPISSPSIETSLSKHAVPLHHTKALRGVDVPNDWDLDPFLSTDLNLTDFANFYSEWNGSFPLPTYQLDLNGDPDLDFTKQSYLDGFECLQMCNLASNVLNCLPHHTPKTTPSEDFTQPFPLPV